MTGVEPAEIAANFGVLHRSGPLNVALHIAFMAAAIAVVLGGVQRGVERAARVRCSGLASPSSCSASPRP